MPATTLKQVLNTMTLATFLQKLADLPAEDRDEAKICTKLDCIINGVPGALRGND